MIYINKDETNKVVLTLSENSSLSSPYYLFKFVNEFNSSPKPIYYTTPDLSINPGRYNLFNIVESASGSTTGGTNVALNLVPGQYNYTVYESSASTLSYSATTGVIIEYGRMVVDGGPSSDDEVEPTQNKTNSIYD